MLAVYAQIIQIKLNKKILFVFIVDVLLILKKMFINVLIKYYDNRIIILP